jgi:hypothetical protein
MAQTTDIAHAEDVPADQGLPPWQFFLLCGMLGATAVVIVATGQAIANILILSATVVAAGFVGLAAYQMLSPLVAPVVPTAPVVAGGRTRAALEREKTLVLRAIKELEFDFAMGKVAQADFDEMGARLRRRAMGLMQQLDANVGYRDQIEKELAALVSAPAPTPAAATGGSVCAGCGTANDIDARFCKQCGTSLKA